MVPDDPSVSADAKIGAVLLVACLLGVILYAVIRVRRTKPSAFAGDACVSPSCLRYQAMLANAVDTSIAACDDFYAHVCRLWTRDHEESVQRVAWNRFVDGAIRDLHETSRTGTITQESAKFFATCLSVVNASNVRSVKKVLAEGGIVWPDRNARPDFLNALFYMSRRVFMPVFFDFSVQNGSLLVASPDEDFQRRLRVLRKHIKSRHLRDHLRTTYEEFGGLNMSRLEEIIEDLDSAEIFVDFCSNVTRTRDGTPELFVENDTTSFFRLAPSVPVERWNTMLRRYFNISFSDLHGVAVRNVDYFRAVFKAHEQKGEGAMNDVVETLCVQNLVQYTSYEIIASFHESGAIQSLREDCFLSTVAFFSYDVNHFLLKTRSSALSGVIQLAERVLEAFFAFIGDSDNRSHTLIHNYAQSHDGNVSNFRNVFTVLKNSAQTAYHFAQGGYPVVTSDPLHNWILFYKSYLRLSRAVALSPLTQYRERDFAKFKGFSVLTEHLDFPYYTPDAHRGVVLGGLGSRIAATVFYDYVESQRDASEIYQRNQDCLAGSSGDEQDLDLQGAVASVPVVLSAFKQSLEATDDHLAGDLPPFPATSILFLFGCYLLCGEPNGERMCNVPLMHSPEFSRVYGCAESSFMNPSNKCTLVL
ncbi:hypothetical protein V5799_031371 [Amblyomma americanum]|uniref:Peptidase M13 N-terminal domain-containing protein n=1 Tax=Amblyomma americanum TaxID=6943 RepID=A0AAQ4EL04_AMBAM